MEVKTPVAFDASAAALCCHRNTTTAGAFLTSDKEQTLMRDAILGLLLAMSILIAAASPVYAGGDQVRGDGGQGTVHQVQVQDPPPFQP